MIQKESNLRLALRLKGGGFLPIRFNNMSEPVDRKFSDTAPDWRIVHRGLSLKGVCVNKKCEAYK
jgi:hypothetical protein